MEYSVETHAFKGYNLESPGTRQRPLITTTKHTTSAQERFAGEVAAISWWSIGQQRWYVELGADAGGRAGPGAGSRTARTRVGLAHAATRVINSTPTSAWKRLVATLKAERNGASMRSSDARITSASVHPYWQYMTTSAVFDPGTPVRAVRAHSRVRRSRRAGSTGTHPRFLPRLRRQSPGSTNTEGTAGNASNGKRAATSRP